MTMTKTLGSVRVKDASEGTITAVFATLGVVDRDGDVTIKGAFTDGAPVIISAYNHGSWSGALPVGKGTISEVGDEAILDGQFFLDTTHGRDAFETVKALGEDGLQEWSYSLEDVVSEKGTVDGHRVNILKSISVREVSPVLRGAGIDTRVLTAKSADRKTLASTTRQLLRSAAVARWGDDDTWVWVVDYDPDEHVAYIEIESSGVFTLYSVDYTIDGTEATLEDEITEVERLTVYAPKGNTFAGRQELALRAVAGLVDTGVDRIERRAPLGKSIDEQVAAAAALSDAIRPLQTAIDTTHETKTADDVTEFLTLVALKNGIPL